MDDINLDKEVNELLDKLFVNNRTEASEELNKYNELLKTGNEYVKDKIAMFLVSMKEAINSRDRMTRLIMITNYKQLIQCVESYELQQSRKSGIEMMVENYALKFNMTNKEAREDILNLLGRK